MEKIEHNQIVRNLRVLGAVLILLGIATLADQVLKTGYLVIFVFTLLGLGIIIFGVKGKVTILLIFGNLIFSLGLADAIEFLYKIVGLQLQSGVLFIGFGIGWGLVFLMTLVVVRKQMFWTLLPMASLISVGYCLTFNHVGLADFVLYIPASIGFAMLIWGSFKGIFGLIIPGSLLIGTGLGIYFGWGYTTEANYLAQTGIMLVIFALGWFLITLFSRVITEKYIWWPLIPGGILAMVGWGLYIGGNPGNALSFIGKTGSVGLIIFGIYLLLFRRGIQQ